MLAYAQTYLGFHCLHSKIDQGVHFLMIVDKSKQTYKFAKIISESHIKSAAV